jgi:speckle-type POZ protein
MQRLSVRFDGFPGLPHEVGDTTHGPKAELHGHTWRLYIDPGGADDGESNDWVGVYLHLDRPHPEAGVKANVTLRLINQPGGADHFSDHRMLELGCDIYGESGSPPGAAPSWGFRRFIKRADILDPARSWLKDGAIVVEADIQVYSKTPPLWRPPSRVLSNFLRLFESGAASDVTFVVEGERIAAHRAVLVAQASVLSGWCDDAEAGADIHVGDITAADFKEILRFLYCDELSSPDVLATAEHARVMLKAANRLGVIRLKQLAEIELATQHLSVESTADLLLFADAHTCPLLRESAVGRFVSQAPDVMATEGWTRLGESNSLLRELMGLLASPRKRAAPDAEGEDRIKRLRVSELRTELSEKGLETDGSRVELEERMQSHSPEQGRGRGRGHVRGLGRRRARGRA